MIYIWSSKEKTNAKKEEHKTHTCQRKQTKKKPQSHQV